MTPTPKARQSYSVCARWMAQAGSATEVFALRVIEAAGLDPDKDVRQERLGAAEGVNALKDRKIEAFFWVAGLPTAAVTDLATTPTIKIKLIDIVQYATTMNAKYGPLYAEATIPAVTYKGMEADAKNITVLNIMAVNASMDEQLACGLRRIMLDARTWPCAQGGAQHQARVADLQS
ncbi:MAG: TAXI family TRAP transporter solute-binding subunit [Hyphomicrobiaceae bacterium]|nr:TAXI family TRAP transporter solute-binding subunit [Hyphomicrobiaceae bacterium]